jgi:DNA-binding PadR family transcriptional regulator
VEPSQFELVTLKHLIEKSLPLVRSGSIWEFKDGSTFAADYLTIKSLRSRGWIEVNENGADEKRGPWILSEAGRRAFSDLRPTYDLLAQRTKEEQEIRVRAHEKSSRDKLGRKGVYLAEYRGIWLRGLWFLK